MAKNEEDLKLEKIGRLLERGGTMLAQHCECGAPMFRYQGKVICPVCNSDTDEKAVKKEKSKTVSSSPEKNSALPSYIQSAHINSKRPTEAQIQIDDTLSPETGEFIKNTIINKIVQLCLDVQRETDLGRIKQQMETIESGTRVLKNLKNR